MHLEKKSDFLLSLVEIQSVGAVNYEKWVYVREYSHRRDKEKILNVEILNVYVQIEWCVHERG